MSFFKTGFNLRAAGSNVATELLAGVTTFLAMSYIAVVNPQLLSQAGMDFGAVFVATCLAAAFGSAVMGVLANYPVALAPGMGINAFFVFAVVPAAGGSWQIALGCVLISGALFLVLSITPFREWLINAIPRDLKYGIAAGIGLFLAMIGLQAAGVVKDHPATLVSLGDLGATTTLLALFGFITIATLHALRAPGAILIGVLSVTGLAILFGLVTPAGIVSMPPSVLPTLFAADVAGALSLSFVTVILTFLLIDLLDTSGTLIAVGDQGGLTDERGRLANLPQALVADSGATVFGAVLGTSTTTSYIESATGIETGGRTGLTALVVAALFLAALFFAPLAQTVPAYATAPALLFVALLMMGALAKINWADPLAAVPAATTALLMPLTFSISTGIGAGFVVYTILSVTTGRFRDFSPAVALIATAFVALEVLK